MSINSELLLAVALLAPTELSAAGLIEPLVTFRIESDFGLRVSSIGKVGKHEGIDYAALAGTPVRSVAKTV